MNSSTLPLADVAPTASRYELHELLGRGGMASVYRATDRATGREVALKQMIVDATAPQHARVAALFEREFHTLAQLQHPHVIAVYDYGLTDASQPYYTMELLDGGDLRDRAPLPWREACHLLFDVCSSLALLHSRRLLHRDISPRNVRCTRDGHAKLIDFGAMVPMSAGGADVVGTPAFTPPETLHRLAIDARTDLFSLGATFYHALTGRLPYGGRTFAEVMTAWRYQVAPPSALIPGIPPALDDLVLALINVEPKLRPQRAFDVMQRLAAIAGIEARESGAVSRAYLATPTLVGRDDVLRSMREQLLATRMSGGASILLTAERGLGRSRLLDSCALEAKTLGFTVLRAAAGGKRESFAALRDLTQHLLDTWPDHTLDRDFPELFAARTPANDTAPAGEEPTSTARVALRDWSEAGLDHAGLQDALCKLFIGASTARPLMIAVDDVHRVDQPSAAVLLALADRTRRGRIFSALTMDSDADADDLRNAFQRRCQTLALRALAPEETEALLSSLFGDVEHLAMLASELHKVAAGNPQQSLDLCQHLIDRGLIHYAAGTWTLPSRLSSEDLPRNETEAMRARVAQLSLNARYLAEAHALAYYETFTDQQYRALLPQEAPSQVERALSELQQAKIIVRDDTVYTLANRSWTRALTAQLDRAAACARHAALADLYTPNQVIAEVHHSFCAGLTRRGLDALTRHHAEMSQGYDHARLLQQNVGKMIWCFEPALQAAQELGYPARAIHELRRWHFGGCIAVEDGQAPESRHAWLAQLIHDSGLDLYRADTQATSTTERLTRALQAAYARYLATPEAERVYPVDEAIRRLAEYVVFSIGIGGRGQDSRLVVELPELLAPFVPLSKALEAIYHNAVATRAMNSEGRLDLARERWLASLEMLDALSPADMQHLDAIRNAVAYAIGLVEAQLGLPSAARWPERLDGDPYQKVGALHLRKIIRMQEGDFQGAEKLRRQAEILSLQLQSPPMFRLLLTTELLACAKARDLDGVRQARDNMQPLAARFPGWQPSLLIAEGYFHAVRLDHESARAKFEQCIALTEPDRPGHTPNPLARITAHAGLAESLLALDQPERARAVAEAALRTCMELDVGSSAFEVVRVLALAEAKLGLSGAVARLDALISEQERRGVSGMLLGICYESRAQIALWQGDAGAFAQYAELTGRAYRHGAHGPLAARYETLINQAQRQGFRASGALAEFKTSTAFDTAALRTHDLASVVSRSMTGTQLAQERADVALNLVCTACGANAGHLYLVVNEGVSLRASHGAHSQPPNREEVQQFLARELERADALTEMATGEIVSEAPAFTAIESEGTTYQLIQLSCVVDAVTKIAGVIAVAGQPGAMQDARVAQLVSALAAFLLRAGDTPGVVRTCV